MPNEIRKHLLDTFQAHLLEDFSAYCELHGLKDSNERLVTYLIDRELIPGPSLQRYTVQREVMAHASGDGANKTQVVGLVAHRFSISERTVWNMLRQGKGTNGD